MEKATCTSLKQVWGKVKDQVEIMYETVPLGIMCHGIQKPNQYPDLNKEKFKVATELLLKGKKTSCDKIISV